jgi:gamma-glutamyltranspeptidase/glutathione hydrolase
MRPRAQLVVLCWCLATLTPIAEAGSVPVRARNGMVVSQNALASQVGIEVLAAGGNATDAAVATAFALAVVLPRAGNIGGGGFLLLRTAAGGASFYDFRETAPLGAAPTMFLANGRYDSARQHDSHLSVGIPGTVAGLRQAWQDTGSLPWKTLLQPAIDIARRGFRVSDGLARSLRAALPGLARYPASLAHFTRAGTPYEMGDLFVQPDLAATLERIADQGAPGFYEGKTAALIEEEMKAGGGLITREDLKAYRVKQRIPLRGTYRGYEILAAPPPSSGGVCLIECLNVLESYDVGKMGFASSAYVHHVAEALRRAFADRARWLGDPDFVEEMPIARLTSKEYAAEIVRSIHGDRASRSSPASFEWPAESPETTHFSVVDRESNAVSLTYTLEDNYGSKIVVPGAGFLLNNEMGDFNAGPGLTDETGLVGTEPNLAAPGKRMLSSMTPTIVVKDGRLFMALGAAGGRKIPGTVLQIILDVVDFGMNVQEAVDAPRVNHQWLPDEIVFEPYGLSRDTQDALVARGHTLRELEAWSWSRAQAILVNAREGLLEGGLDRRRPDGGAIGR